jgi:hypothetical protein
VAALLPAQQLVADRPVEAEAEAEAVDLREVLEDLKVVSCRS